MLPMRRIVWTNRAMKFWPIIFGLLLMQHAYAQTTNNSSKFFPYSWTRDTLTSGLRLVTVPTDDKNLVTVYVVVRTGSRNEVEPGKSAFADFSEHKMSRGSENSTSDQRQAIMKKAGAEENAYT